MSRPSFSFRACRRIEKSILTPLKISRLVKSHSSHVASVARAIRAVTRSELLAEERRWFESIEHRRQELSASTDVVVLPDFGAGNPAEAREAEQMQSGVVSRESVGEACRAFSKEAIWCAILFEIVRHFKPASCVEMGTCLGISGAYEAAALELNGGGSLITMEGAPAFAEIARDTFASLGLKHRVEVVVGPFHSTLDSVLLKASPVDFCFIDGHHDEQATMKYFESVRPRLSNCAVVLLDDIRWSPGMLRAWKRIRSDSCTSVSIDLGKMGICLVGVGVKKNYTVSLE